MKWYQLFYVKNVNVKMVALELDPKFIADIF